MLDTVGRRALTYYAGQNPSKLDPDALGRRARALQLVAEVRNLRGDSDGALTAFKQAAATTGELLARQPNDGQRIFDHSQSVFWVGYIAWQRGDLKTGRDFFTQYLSHAQTLAKKDPANAAWNGEVGFASQTLGILELDDNRAALALRYFDAAERVWDRIAEQSADKRDANYYRAQAIAWRADAHRKMLDPGRALEDRGREIGIYQRLLAADPKDSKAKEGLVVARLRTAQLKLETGLIRDAGAIAERSLADIRALLEQDPSNRLVAGNGGQGRQRAHGSAHAEWRLGRRARGQRLGDRSRGQARRGRHHRDRMAHRLPAARALDADRAQRRRWSGRPPAGCDLRPRFCLERSGKATEEERFAWIMVDMLDGAHWRSAGDASKAKAGFARAAGRLPAGTLTDARLLAVAAWLNRYQPVSGLPATAPAAASRVRYDVGALLGNRKG